MSPILLEKETRITKAVNVSQIRCLLKAISIILAQILVYELYPYLFLLTCKILCSSELNEQLSVHIVPSEVVLKSGARLHSRAWLNIFYQGKLQLDQVLILFFQ